MVISLCRAALPAVCTWDGAGCRFSTCDQQISNNRLTHSPGSSPCEGDGSPRGVMREASASSDDCSQDGSKGPALGSARASGRGMTDLKADGTRVLPARTDHLQPRLMPPPCP